MVVKMFLLLNLFCNLPTTFSELPKTSDTSSPVSSLLSISLSATSESSLIRSIQPSRPVTSPLATLAPSTRQKAPPLLALTSSLDPELAVTNSQEKHPIKIVLSNTTLSPWDKILVSVYYECLCPDSRSWILRQLYPAWQRLSHIIDVDFIPYGKASSRITARGEYRFVCQHGPTECKGDIYHACAVHHIKNPEDRMEYVKCMIYDNYQPKIIAKRCFTEMGWDAALWTNISSCAQGRQGKELHFQAGQKTHSLKPKMTFVPTIEINGNQGSQKDILRYFGVELCRAYQVYKGNQPTECLSVL